MTKSPLHFLLTFALLATISHQRPQIFSEIETCEVPVENKGKITNYRIPARIDARSADMRVVVTLCIKNNYVPAESTSSTVSVYNKTHLLGSDSPKPYQASQDKKGILISLQNEIKCDQNDNYYISIKIDDLESKVPRLIMNGDCEMEIEVASPSYDPSCMKHVGGKWFIDLTPFRNRPVTVWNDKRERYVISLCGPIRQCGREVGCKIGTNGTTIIGSLKNAKVRYNNNNLIEVYSKTEKPIKSMTVTIKCSWDVPYHTKPRLLNEGTHHKFEVYSSFGCVKTPRKCEFKDESLLLSYNLANLTPTSGSIVRNTRRNIRLNICGDLTSNWPSNFKSRMERSQVSEIIGNKYINRGSIPNIGLENHTLRARFVDGDVCNENETYSTTVDFTCSLRDTGPTFTSEEGCTTKLSWETSQACPKVEMVVDNGCTFSSPYGSLNLTELYGSNGYSSQISHNQKLLYNLCGKLNMSCSDYEDVSACLTERNKQKVIGWNKPVLTFINGNIQLKYKGEKCDSSQLPYTFVLDFSCSFEETIMDVIRKDDCTFGATVKTRSACLKSWKISECLVDEDNYKYDLSSLMRKTESYKIRDTHNRDITYFLNLCAPVVPEKDALLYAGSMVYMSNSSIASIQERFTPLGYVADPILKDDALVIEAQADKCNANTLYSSKISFECSDEDGLPYLLRKDGCHYDFMWKTKHACPIMKKGRFCLLMTGNNGTQVPGDPIELKIDNDNTYYLSLCLDHYRWCRSNGGACTTKTLTKNVQIQNNEAISVRYTLNDSRLLQTIDLNIECDPYKKLSFTKEYSRRDHLTVFLRTRSICKIGRPNRSEQKRDHIYEYKVDDETENKTTTNISEHQPSVVQNKSENKAETNISDHKPTVVQNISETDNIHKSKDIKDPVIIKNEEEKTEPDQSKYNESSKFSSSDRSVVKDIKEDKTVKVERQLCEINDIHGRRINLYELESVEFKGGNDVYIFNFDGNSPKCKGLLCKNGDDILSFIEKCPSISHDKDRTILKYTTIGQCVVSHSSASLADMQILLSLGCNVDEVTSEAIEQDCVVTIKYSSPKICYNPSSHSSLSIVIFTILVIVLLVSGSVVFVLYKKNYFKKCSYDSVSENDSLVVHSKML